MKVIGLISDIKYLVEIDKTEIEKFLNLYYNKMNKLKVGDDVDLSKGYDWAAETKQALDQTQKFFKTNIKTINAITKAFLLDKE